MPNPLDPTHTLHRRRAYVNLSAGNTFTLGKGWAARVPGLYSSPSIERLFDFDAYSYGSAAIPPVAFENHRFNDTRQVRLDFPNGFGQASFKRKRVETTNAAERGRPEQ